MQVSFETLVVVAVVIHEEDYYIIKNFLKRKLKIEAVIYKLGCIVFCIWYVMKKSSYSCLKK